jgi:hypothetical protein
VFHDLEYRGNLGTLVVIGPHHGVPIGHKPWPVSQGSWPAVHHHRWRAGSSRVFSRSVDATKAHDMTLAGGASFNSKIFLMEVAVDRALKGSMAGERMNKSFGREVREKETS